MLPIPRTPVDLKAALTSDSCLSLSHLAFRNVCSLSPTAGNCVGWFMRSFNVQSPLVNLTRTLEGENLRRFICVYFLLFSSLLLAIASILPREAIPTHVGYPVMCPNAVLIIQCQSEIEGKEMRIHWELTQHQTFNTLSHLVLTMITQGGKFHFHFTLSKLKYNSLIISVQGYAVNKWLIQK